MAARNSPLRVLMLSAGLGVFLARPAPAAEIFEKIGNATPISATGISYAFPATARAAGWTVVALESRLAMSGSNPAFVAGGDRAEVALGTTWTHRSGETSVLDLVDDTVRFDAGFLRARVSSVSLVLGYQNPYHLEEELPIYQDTTTRIESNLDVWSFAAACTPRANWHCGASIAMLVQNGGPSRRAYQGSVGVEWQAERMLAAAAFKSELFGEDRLEMLAPALVQVDARYALAPSWAVAASFSGGWWNNTRHGRLHSPADFGAGVSWQAIPAVRLLAGAHHVRDRAECSQAPELCELAHVDQGTFLGAGVQAIFEPVQFAVAVEDNHVNSDGATTAVTLSARAVY
jgi:hypothetical protein